MMRGNSDKKAVDKDFLFKKINTNLNQNKNDEIACDFIKNSVSFVYNIPVVNLNSKTRQQAGIAFARQVAMYIAHVRLGLSFGEVGRTFQRDRTTVGHACRLVEDKRDNEKVDFLINCLERALVEWLKMSDHSQTNALSGELQ